ncbi:MAG: class II histone deacetylase, partial [Pseudomonadota bacterium]
EAIFYDRDDVLTISLHQERNYPMDQGDAADTGAGRGDGANINVPLPPGTGHAGYLAAMERIVVPSLAAYEPDAIIVACGLDASAFDPLGRMLASAETFRAMTTQMQDAAAEICDGRLTLVHEGGYSELHAPFCGHAVIEQLSGSLIRAPDPLGDTIALRQPGPAFDSFVSAHIGAMAEFFGV